MQSAIMSARAAGNFLLRLALLACVIAAGLPAAAAAEPYPAKEIQLIVPFPPGGVTDLTARIVAKHLTRSWRQTVSVVNKPGGGGTTGTMFMLRSNNDGYTMLMSATGQATQNPAIDSKLPYRWDEPTLVARISSSPLVFVVRGNARWKSLRELMEEVRRDPTKFRYGTSGVGGVGIAIARLLGASGVDVSQVGRVALQGGAPLLEAVADGRTHFAAQYLAEMGSMLESKRIKALAVSTAQRVKQLPEVPTAAEAGIDGFNLIGWNGIAGPANLPDEVIRTWDEAIQALVADPGFLAETEALGAAAAYLGPNKFRETLRAEYESALQYAEKLGLRR